MQSSNKFIRYLFLVFFPFPNKILNYFKYESSEHFQ